MATAQPRGRVLPAGDEAAARQVPASDATQLAALARMHNWHRFGVFKVEYERAARALDRSLVASVPSRAQWHRWLSGDLRRLPYVDHCRVLEAMFPGWSSEQLLGPPVHERHEEHVVPFQPHVSANAVATGDGSHADVTAIFANRTDFMAGVSPADLFDGATQIRAAGLSLNMLCQQFADQRLRRLVEDGAHIAALFLDPRGEVIQAREAEEGITPGHLSALTSLNIDLLLRVRDAVPAELRDNLTVGVYDEPIRFNLTFVDEVVCVAQPYLPATRGVDSPTLLIRRRPGPGGLYEVFDRVFQGLSDRATPS
jgi:hypothetical protein